MQIEKEFNLAYRHKDFKQGIFDKLRYQGESEIESVSTKEARTVYNWNRQVAGCYQRSRAFSRLKISKHGIVYGRIDPEHYVEDMVAEWFLSRFPLFTVMIESRRGTFVISGKHPLKKYVDSIEKLLPEFEAKMPINSLLEGLMDFNEDSFWETYYDSQFIETRKNKRYFLHNIPKKFHNWESLRTEKRRFDKNTQILDFIG